LMGYALLPIWNVGLIAAVIGLGIARGFAEFFLVSMISLLSEQVPERRARVMTLNTASTQISFAIAGFVGPWLYVRTHIMGLSISGALLLAIAIGLILFWVREREGTVAKGLT
jgi:predicted MFS family arabinose efflux permease